MVRHLKTCILENKKCARKQRLILSVPNINKLHILELVL